MASTLSRVLVFLVAGIAIFLASASVDLNNNGDNQVSTVVPKTHFFKEMNPEYSPHILPYWFMMEKMMKQWMPPMKQMPGLLNTKLGGAPAGIKHSPSCPQGTDRNMPCQEATVYAVNPGEELMGNGLNPEGSPDGSGPYTLDIQQIPMPESYEGGPGGMGLPPGIQRAEGQPPEMTMMDPAAYFGVENEAMPPFVNPQFMQMMFGGMGSPLFRDPEELDTDHPGVDTTGNVPKDLNWMIRGPVNMQYTELETFLFELTRYYKDSTRLEVLGSSVENRTLYAVVLCYNKLHCRTRPLLKPKIRLAANFHGNHGTSRAIITFLILYLQLHREHNPRVQALLASAEIHIIPTVNPDGYEQASADWERLRRFSNISEGYLNANGVDLDTDYPSIWDYSHTSQIGFWDDREPETVAMMKYSLEELFVMSGSFGDGDLVIRLPLWSHQMNYTEPEIESRPPDFDVFMQIGHEYAFRHPVMNKKEFLCARSRTHFFDGVENGAFVEPKGRHAADWHYKFANAFDWYIYVSCFGMTITERLDVEWTKNINSIIAFMESVNRGVEGMVWDNRTGNPVADAYVEVMNRRHRVRTNERGEYWRLLNDGVYMVRAIKRGYAPSDWDKIRIFNAHGAVTNHFYLSPKSSDHESGGGLFC